MHPAEILWTVVMGFLLVGSVGFFLSIYNSLVEMKNNVGRSWANIDVLLKQRHDELPKLVKTCEGYMQHERAVFDKLSEARGALAGGALGRAAGRGRGPAHPGARAVLRGRRELSRPQGEPGLPVAAAAHQRAGEPDRRPARVLQRHRDALQHAHPADPGLVGRRRHEPAARRAVQGHRRGPPGSRDRVQDVGLIVPPRRIVPRAPVARATGARA